eukprot:393964_1
MRPSIPANDIVGCGVPPNNLTEKSQLISKHKLLNAYNTISTREKNHIATGSTLPNGKSSMTGVYYNFMNSLVGAGILGLPYVYPNTGLFGGILLQFLFAILSIYTLKILIIAAQKQNVHDYEQLGYKCFGNTGYFIVMLCLLLQDFGSMLNYLIIIGDSAFKIIQIWGYNTETYRQYILLIVCFTLIFPPCLLRDIAFYEKFSFIKLITIFLVVSVIIYEYTLYNNPKNISPDSTDIQITFFNFAGLPRALGILAYTFEVHDAAFLYYNTLFNPTIKRWQQLSIYGVLSAIILGLLLSIPAYLTFGDNIKSNVLNSYQLTSLMIILARIIYAITMALTYPTAFFVVRHVLYMSYQKIVYCTKRKRIMRNINVDNIMTNQDFNNLTFENNSYTIKTSPLIHHMIFTILLFCTNVIIALYINNLGIALVLVGSIASVNLIFILPAIFYWKSIDKNYTFWQYKGAINKLNAFKDIYGSLLLVAFGLMIGIIGISSVIIPNQF